VIDYDARDENFVFSAATYLSTLIQPIPGTPGASAVCRYMTWPR